MTRRSRQRRPVAALALLALLAAVPAAAQSSGAPSTPPSPEPPAVGAMAPDFTLPGATRHGLLARPVRLSDYRGETVVLAFFFRARTKG